MSDAPERIWAYETPNGDTGWLCDPTHGQVTGSTEYLRSDIAASQLAEANERYAREAHAKMVLQEQLAEARAALENIAEGRPDNPCGDPWAFYDDLVTVARRALTGGKEE